ncbi:MAG: GNAT family N-acetyltransferase [Rhodobacteraceae bacterium]|nr:GNAT family N-acetyltransferase [Paracoccaceae bacterium]
MSGALEIRIRPLREDDEAEWRRLWTGYLEFYEASVGEDVYRSTFARLLGDDPQDFNGLVADTGSGLAGIVHFLFHRHCWKIENTCYLQDLYADPAYRGKGIGRALIEAVYDAADAEGAPSVYWLTQDHNTQARLLYDRIGQLTPFIRYNRKPAS